MALWGSQVRILSAPPSFAGAARRRRMPRRSVWRRRASLRNRVERSGYGSASYPKMVYFHYVYILESQLEDEHFYVGLTEDVKARLAKHNSGEVPHTSKFKPWRIKTAIAFTDPNRAAAFERYLKSGSGRAFAKRHF